VKQWYIVVFTSVDYYTLFEGAAAVKAKHPKQAIKRARKKLGIPQWYPGVVPEKVWGPLDEKPQGA